jgi:CMP/dCMP kinase
MKIFVCGFSATGKSCVVESIAKDLNLKIIHASDILKQISIGKVKDSISIENTKMNTGWYENSNLDLIRKKNDNLDLELDKFLLNYVRKNDNFIIDSWTLPYLYKKGFKIWLKADVIERIKRMSKRDNIDYEQASKLINKKDNFSKNKFKKLYNFELGKDLSNFDYIIDTTNLSIKEIKEKILLEIKKEFKI